MRERAQLLTEVRFGLGVLLELRERLAEAQMHLFKIPSLPREHG